VGRANFVGAPASSNLAVVRPRSEENPVLGEPAVTQWDVKFRLFGTPVRVHPLFWVLAVLLGRDALNVSGVVFLVWIGVVFVSILVHEFGHVFAFKRFGADSHVVLSAFGGLAVPWNAVRQRWQRVVVSLAGPAAGFVFCGCVYASQWLVPWVNEDGGAVYYLYRFLIRLNLFWGVINLLPILPLDGGRVSEEVCGSIFKRNGLRVALEISIAFAGVLALYGVACEIEHRQGGGWISQLPDWFPRGDFYTALLFGYIAYLNYQMLQHTGWVQSHWDEPDDDRPPWKR
jgi:Zn-dependent protease